MEFVVLGKNINPNPDKKVVDYNFIDIMATKLLIVNNILWQKDIDDISCIHDSKCKLLNYINSDIIKELNSTMLQLFPKEIKNMIISKKERFLTGCNTITSEKIFTTVDVGKVWLPSIKEITNKCDMSDADPESNQYPYFENKENRKLGDWWWTCSAWAFSGYSAFFISSDGGHYYGCAADSDWGSSMY